MLIMPKIFILHTLISTLSIVTSQYVVIIKYTERLDPNHEIINYVLDDGRTSLLVSANRIYG